MSEKTGNIRVFRTTFQDGRHAFEEKYTDGRGSTGCGSVRSLAHNARDTVKRMQEDGCGTVGIDFSPSHDIDCPNGLAPRLCSSLTGEEQAEFWKHFFDEE